MAGTNEEQKSDSELFAGMNAAITFATDAESRDLTGNIIGILRRARWDAISATPESPLFSNPEPPKVVGGGHLKLVPLSGFLSEGVSVIARPDGVRRRVH